MPPTSRLEDLLGAPFFYYGKVSGTVRDTTLTVTLISEVFDVVVPFEGWKTTERKMNAIPLLCDEFSVSVHLDDLAANFTTVPTFTSASLVMEAISDKNTTTQTPVFAVANSPSTFTAALSGTNGFTGVFVPGARAFRFKTTATTGTASVPASPGIYMEVTGRLRNHAAVLMALDRMVRGKGQWPAILTEKTQHGFVKSIDLAGLCR